MSDVIKLILDYIVHIRVGSVWILRFWFDSVFSVKYSVSVFCSFCIRTPLQCKSILVC